MKEVTLKRLSICACGFPCLNESIPLGTAYSIDPDDTRVDIGLKCGGCGAIIRGIPWVRCSQVLHPDLPWDYLPYQIFLDEREPIQ